MSRYVEANCKLCRREGTKLFLKGSRCLTEKCAVEKRAYAPGQHGQASGRRRKASQYSRQLVRHRHVEVNGRPVDVPSYQLRPGDEIRITQASRELDVIAASLELASKGQPVSWVSVDRGAMSGKIVERPTRDVIPIAAEEQLIVELYSK